MQPEHNRQRAGSFALPANPARRNRTARRPEMAHLFLLLALVIAAAPAGGAETAPADVRAFDTPDDQGRSITLTWRRYDVLPDSVRYRIGISERAEGPFYHVAELDPKTTPTMADEPATFGTGEENRNRHFALIESYRDPEGPDRIRIENGKAYFIRIGVHGAGQTVVEARARGNYFNTSKLGNFALAGLFSVLILVYIRLARRKDLYIRRLAGLDALDEALGRATEMGKPVLFVHGLQDMGSPSTIAAVNILGQVAKRTAEYDTQLKVGNRDPIVMSVSQEVVKESCIEAGRPDAFNPDNVFLAAADQFSYAAALEGLMVREKPAANLLMGYFYAESLLLAETGSTTGAIQIAATDAYTQLPFFITTCDYTLMGEELYAASAYLSRDPKLLGSLKGQDLGKGVIILMLMLGTILAGIGFWPLPG